MHMFGSNEGQRFIQDLLHVRLPGTKLLSGGKGKKQIGKISASEVSRVVSWGGGKGGGAWRHAFDAAVP